MVLSEPFAVVSHAHDHSVSVLAAGFEVSNEVRQSRVGVSDFAIVEMIFVSLCERRRRLIRIMRIVQMHPHEVRTRGMLRQPTLRMRDYIHAAALEAPPARFSGRVFGKVVVEIKTPAETGRQCRAVKNHCADERGSAIATRFQQFGDRGMRVRQGDAEIRDPVRTRQQTG